MAYIWEGLGETGVQDQEALTYVDSERPEIREVFSHNPKRVLDIGCAKGAVGLGLKRDYDAFVWGIELNAAAAEVAVTRLDKVTTTPIEQLSAEDFALLQTIDTVCLLDVLEHMYNPWSVLSFLSKHLPEHAQIIVSLPNISNVSVMMDLNAGYWHYKSAGVLDITHIRFFTPFEMDAMMCQTGYTIQNVRFLGLLDSFWTLTEDSDYPVWKQFGDIKIFVRNYEHWLCLNSVQVVFRAKITPDELLEELARNKRFAPHPPTLTF